MNIWILKYGADTFDEKFVKNAPGVTEGIDQLENYQVTSKQVNKFHFLSIHTPFQFSQKKYLSVSDNAFKGYSGLMIGKTDSDTDLRTVDAVDTSKPENYNGQFALFNLSDDTFECLVDNFGFHKVFYFKQGADIYISNSMALLRATGKLKSNIEQITLDFMTGRFGIYPGYNTLYEDVFTLPEYGKATIANGELSVERYKPIESLLVPDKTFEEQLVITANEFKMAAQYLRNYHHTVIGVSGGHDGRFILNFFHNTTGLPLEAMTYNRAGKLDFLIAARLSRMANVPHHKFSVPSSFNDFEAQIPEFRDMTVDAFYVALQRELKGFYNTGESYKVHLGGNGADTDWEFGENRIKNVDKSNFDSFIKTYSQLMTTHPLVDKAFSAKMADKVAAYLLDKYKCFKGKQNFMQLLASAFFHLERFRGNQGFSYSQISNKRHDIFAPFATESFNQLVFLAQKDQLQRTLRIGIHHRISEILTNNKVPYAPILTARNELGDNVFQKALNYIFPYLPKLIWKLNNGDTNTVIRKRFSKKINELSRDFITEEKGSPVWKYIDLTKIEKDLTESEYKGQYNSIATMLKFIKNN